MNKAKPKDPESIARKLLQLLTKATGNTISRSKALRSLLTTAAALDAVAESLRLQGKIGVELSKPAAGRPAISYTLTQKSVRESQLEAIGRLIVEVVRLAGGVK